jgi:enterochelin esterase-like enzyme
VRLRSDLTKRGPPPEFVRHGRSRTWELRLPVPPGLHRLEYQLELEHAGGRKETVIDPGNPRRVAAPFGERSVVELDRYVSPVWLADEDAAPGDLAPLRFRSRLLRTGIEGLLWSAADTDPEEPLPLLVVHDGPKYAGYALLLRLFDSAIAELELPAFRAALLQPPGDRNENYSASARYAHSLAREIIPHVYEQTSVIDLRGARVGMGASLGALAAFHAHRLHPRLFGGLFLQSGSFFTRRTDSQERRFPRFERVTRFVAGVHRTERWEDPIPVVMSCGLLEENAANNHALRESLLRQRYDVRLYELPDLHNWVCWRDSFHPHLVDLLDRLWG